MLALLTDMTNFADAMKEIAITMEQIPSNRGYPGDLYSQLAARYEKAVDFDGAGSITILAVTTMPGDDVTHPVPDNTGYITEGQFYLRGGRIEPFGSLSRLKQQVNGKTRSDHRTIMNTMIQLFAAYRDVITSYSIHYTKLYDRPWPSRRGSSSSAASTSTPWTCTRSGNSLPRQSPATRSWPARPWARCPKAFV